MGGRGHEPGARYRGTEPTETGRGGHDTATQHPASDRAHISKERRRLFTAEAIDINTAADIFIGATKEIQPSQIGELIAAMSPQQPAASLQQLALKWRELKGGEPEETQTCRSLTSDSQLLRPATSIYMGATHTFPKRTQGRPPELPRESGEIRKPPNPFATYPRRPQPEEQKPPTSQRRKPQAMTTNHGSQRRTGSRLTQDRGPP